MEDRCAATQAEKDERMARMRELVASARRVTVGDTRAIIELDAALHNEITEIIRTEGNCCDWLFLEASIKDDHLQLVVSPPGVVEMLR